MAYYNASGQVTIDEAAASLDIRNMREAIGQLEASRDSINNLRRAASTMHGQTGSAIEEQCGRLSDRITSLVDNLRASIQFIQSTVARYQEEDHRVAQQIRSGGGI